MLHAKPKIAGIPTARATHRQREFFDVRRMTHGLCRYYAGDFCEEATAALTGATRLKTDSRRVTCPDLQFSPRQFLESKSVGRTNEAILYKVRLDRDRDFCGQGNELFYCFWHHNYRVTEADCKYDLHAKLAGHLLEVVVVPFAVIWEMYRDVPVKLLNNALSKSGKIIGWGPKDYGWGWNIPLRPLAALCTDISTISTLRVYDATITNLRVRCHPDITLSAPSLILPPSIEFKASVLLNELLSSRLEVAKWPGRFGEGYVRGCVSCNTRWYSEFCKQFPRSPCRRFRKPGRTIIKRIDIIRALKKIIAGPDKWRRRGDHEYHAPNVMRLLDFMEGWDFTNHTNSSAPFSPEEKREHQRIMEMEF